MQTVHRLIDTFTPSHYDLSLTLHRVEREFNGTTTITGVAHTNGSISVHEKDLTITSVTLDGKEANWTKAENDELIISHDDIAKNNSHLVVIGFSGKITDAMHGLYPCYYEHNGEKKELLATQFESHHAREVFPCIDEPEAKATFSVTLTTEQAITVLGNMPISSQKTENNALVTTFEKTPKMSTYLLAWVTGELQRKTATTQSGVEVNIWATQAQPAASLDFALDTATRTIDFYNEYYGTDYPLPKSDHVALPDFSSGAMENWGLITYRETTLLAHPTATSISSRQYIALVIAHELSHQWFGNLVTMKWWNNLWLNESFATMTEFIAIDALYPQWDIWQEFTGMNNLSALRRDAIDGVQPVQTEVNHPDEISTLFDGAIVYAKGARLLRMLQQYIGDDAFRAGIQQYFKAFAYKNTEANDLWNKLSEASGKDITTFMNTWISQPGYPVVTVTRRNNTLTLTQEQFFVGPHSASNALWPIPLDSTLAELPNIFDTKTITVPIKNEDTVQLNKRDSAHFITKYDDDLLATRISAVSNSASTPLERLQLLHEQSLLARGGFAKSAQLIPLLSAYRHESSETVWDIMSMCIGELKKFTFDDPVAEQQLRRFAADIAREQYAALGIQKRPNESEEQTKLRSTIVSTMLYGEDPQAITDALALFTQHTPETLDADLRPLIMSAAIRFSGDSDLFDSLIALHNKTHSADLQQDIVAALTSTKDAAQLSTLLGLITNERTVRPQDAIYWFIWTMRNKDGRTLAWHWLQNNWTWIVKTFSGDKSYDDFPRYAASCLLTASELEEYKTFFTPMMNEPALTRVITMGISDIEGRVALIERDKQAVCDMLAQLDKS